jgi:hypothetical protein
LCRTHHRNHPSLSPHNQERYIPGEAIQLGSREIKLGKHYLIAHIHRNLK